MSTSRPTRVAARQGDDAGGSRDGRGSHGRPWQRRVALRDLLAEIAVIGLWVLACLVVFGLAGGVRDHGRVATVGIWAFSALSGVTVATALVLRRVEARRSTRSLLESADTLRSIELITEPALSFLGIDALLDELMSRTSQVVGAELVVIYLLADDRASMTIRASLGFASLSADAATVMVGEGVVGQVAAAGDAVVVEDVEDPTVSIPAALSPMASLMAAPMLVGGNITGVIVVGTRRHERFDHSDLDLLRRVADRAGASIERARLDDAERRSRLGVEHAQRHLAVLADVGDVLAAALESYDEALVRMAGVVVPQFSDWFAVDLTDDDGRLRRVSASGAGTEVGPVPDGRPVSGTPVAHLHPDGDRLVRTVMGSGRSRVLMAHDLSGPERPRRSVIGAYAEVAPAPGIESMIVVPVHVRGLSFGALSFVNRPGRRGYRLSDVKVAEAIAGRVAVAVERVLLWRESRYAERAATRHAAQLRRLTEAALAVNAPLAEHEVLRLVALHARRVLGAERAMVADAAGVEDAGGRPAAASPEEPVGQWAEIGRSALAAVAAAGRVVRSPGVAPLDAAERAAASSDGGTTAWMAAPLNAAGSGAPLRVLVVAGGAGGAGFGAEDESMLVLLAQMGAVALENARLYQASHGNEQRLRAVVDSSPLAIAELELDGRARWWNRAAATLFGWDSGDVAARIPEADQTQVLEAMWARARRGVATVGATVTVPRPDGGALELSVSTAALVGADGTPTGILAVAEDVTERRRLLEQFHQAQRLGAMARLAGGVAHDFNNLLTVILGSAEMLRRRLPPGSELAGDVGAIERAGRRAADMTGQLLAIGHRRPLQPQTVEPDSVIDGLEPALVRAVGPDVRLEHHDGARGSCILVDPVELERAVLNLALNARDAMPGGGVLTIDTRLEPAPEGRPGRLVLSVADTGVGMSADVAAHCFEPFFTTKERARGTGLGLTAVHASVTQAGGDVAVESTVGIGTTFVLTFPVVPGDASVVDVGSAAGAVAASEGGVDDGSEPAPADTGVLLVVDDEDELRRLAVRQLEAAGFDVLEARSGPAALAVAEGATRPVDLLVSDVVMPGMSGVDLADRLARQWPAMRVLFMTAHVDDGATSGHRFANGADVLAKPFTPADLVARVRDVLRRQGAEASSVGRSGPPERPSSRRIGGGPPGDAQPTVRSP